MNIKAISEHSIISARGDEIVLFLIQPTNVSVLSREGLKARINALMYVLKGFAEVELLCLNSRESFENNKRYLTERMAEEESGEGGFGYDALFIPEGHNATFAVLPAEEKNAISHRARALHALRAILK